VEEVSVVERKAIGGVRRAAMAEEKRSGLSSNRRALALVLIGLLGLLGLWLGSNSQFWLGLIAFLGAFAGAMRMAHLDLRPTEQERRRGWERIRQHGKLRYIGRQVLQGWPVLLFLLAIDLFSSYRSGTLWDPRWFATFLAVMFGGSVLISLGWWYWQVKKYGSGS